SHPSFFFLFTSSVPPPPTSTLFPYTTLFRSLGRLDTDRRRRHPLTLRRGNRGERERGERGGRQREDRGGKTAPHRTAGLAVSRTDRKSTRLNSSHVAISYAVFCLKKKKKQKK